MVQPIAPIILGVSTILLSLITAILMFVIAGSMLAGHENSCALVLASAIVQLISCLCLVALLTYQYRRGTSKSSLGHSKLGTAKLLPILILGIVPAIVTAIVVGSALGWSEANLTQSTLLIAGATASNYLTVAFVIWGISALAHVVSLGLLVWRPKSKIGSLPLRFPINDAPREMVEPNRPGTATTVQSNSFRETTPSSPPSLVPSDGTNSLRSSSSTLRRPASSKRGLLLSHSSYARHSQRSSSDGPSRRPSQDEGFDTWDTSGVSSHIREAFSQTKSPNKRSGLEPIPGSRSPSPAKALEGPFFQPSPSESPPQSPLPQPSVSRPNSPPSSPPELSNFSAFFAPASPPPSHPTSPLPNHNYSRPSSRSQAALEDHIHPLFRTSSPTPPPSASSGTILTAAPEAGQLVTERTLRRMRSGSFPSSPSPLARSESSPDIRLASMQSVDEEAAPPMPILGRGRPGTLHRRKRSASFNGMVEVV